MSTQARSATATRPARLSVRPQATIGSDAPASQRDGSGCRSSTANLRKPSASAMASRDWEHLGSIGGERHPYNHTSTCAAFRRPSRLHLFANTQQAAADPSATFEVRRGRSGLWPLILNEFRRSLCLRDRSLTPLGATPASSRRCRRIAASRCAETRLARPVPYSPPKR